MPRRQGTIEKSGVWLAASLLAACSEPIHPRIYDPGVVHEESGAFPVGEIGSFDGPEAPAFHRGFARAIDECNARGGAQGRHIELQVFDDRGRPEDTAQGAQRLSGPSGAVAIACSSAPECLAAAREIAGAPPLVSGGSGAKAEERGYALGLRLVAAFESAKNILPKEVAAELAAGSARTYPRAP